MRAQCARGGSGTGVLREPSLGAPEPPTQSYGRVASLMNSLLMRRRGLLRHALRAAALRAERVPHRLGSNDGSWVSVYTRAQDKKMRSVSTRSLVKLRGTQS